MVAPKPQRIVGLDLGSASIKLVELERTPAGMRLVRRVLQELPLGSPMDPAQQLSWLQAVMKESRASEVHLALDHPAVAIQHIRVPPMSPEELAEAVKWQVKDLVPFPVAEAVLDYEMIEEVWEKDIKKLSVVVAAVPRRIIQEQLALIAQAGATVTSITPTALAILRTFQALSPERLTASVAIIELGAARTHVVIVKEGRLRLARDLPLGSAEITRALAGVSPGGQGVPFDAAKAERVKRHVGIPTENLEALTEEGVSLGQLAALIHVVLDKLMTDLRRILDFYHVHLHEGGVERLLVVGGGADLKHLPNVLREGLGLPVECYNPLLVLSSTAMDHADVEDGPRLTAALGAALTAGRGVNLIPADLKARRRQTAMKNRMRRVGTVVGAAAAAVYGLLLVAAWSYGHRLRAVERDWQAFEPAYSRSMDLAQQTRRMDGVMTSVRRFRSQQPLWEGIFKELSHATPSGIVLTECVMTRHEWTLHGTVAVSKPGGEGALSRFLDALESSIFFRRARLRSSQLQMGPKGTTFEIVGELE